MAPTPFIREFISLDVFFLPWFSSEGWLHTCLMPFASPFSGNNLLKYNHSNHSYLLGFRFLTTALLLTCNYRIQHNIPSPSHMRGPKVYRPSFSSNGLPVSPNRSCLTGRCSLCVKSPPSSNQLSKPGSQTRNVFNQVPYSEITLLFL